MSWLHRLERWLSPVALPHLTLYLVVAQAFVYLTALLGLLDPSRVMLVPAAVMAGEWWRLLTFVADPPAAHWLFLAFALYFLYLSGSALEEQWGAARYNLFLLVGYLLVVATAFVTPYAPASNLFIGGSIFLAFAQLNPTFTMYVFLVLPIQIRWLALIAWLGYGWSFATGDLATRLSIVAALANYFLFMGHDLWLSLRQGVRRARAGAERREGPQVRHRCYVCGKTDLSHPQLDFRYCSKCAGDQCYCPEHIRNHEHVLTDGDAKQP